MNGSNQFGDSIFESRSFLPIRTIAFCPTSNLFVHFSAKRETVGDTLADSDIAISNSLAESVLKVTKSSWVGSTAILVLILENTSKEDFPSVLVVFGIP